MRSIKIVVSLCIFSLAVGLFSGCSSKSSAPVLAPQNTELKTKNYSNNLLSFDYPENWSINESTLLGFAGKGVPDNIEISVEDGEGLFGDAQIMIVPHLFTYNMKKLKNKIEPEINKGLKKSGITASSVSTEIASIPAGEVIVVNIVGKQDDVELKGMQVILLDKKSKKRLNISFVNPPEVFDKNKDGFIYLVHSIKFNNKK